MPTEEQWKVTSKTGGCSCGKTEQHIGRKDHYAFMCVCVCVCVCLCVCVCMYVVHM